MVLKFNTVNHKAPPGLDFYTFFRVVDNVTRNNMLKQQTNVPASLYLYSSANQTTTSYSLNTDGPQEYTAEALFQLINKNAHDYYVIITEGWGAESDSIPGYQYGDIAKLPTETKKEILIVSGKSKDGKEALTVIYDIIRERAGNDRSKVLRFEKFIDSDEYHWRAEYITLLTEMFKSALVNQNNRPKFLFQNSKTPIPTLEDLKLCLPLQKQSSEIVDIASKMIMDEVRIRMSEYTRIVDVDGCTELSVEGLAEKYFQNESTQELH